MFGGVFRIVCDVIDMAAEVMKKKRILPSDLGQKEQTQHQIGMPSPGGRKR